MSTQLGEQCERRAEPGIDRDGAGGGGVDGSLCAAGEVTGSASEAVG
jgi:hypothetical protein